MSKKILTVGFELASNDTEPATLRSKMSLLDWDIVLFKPEIGDFYSGAGEPYQGKPNLSDSMSFSLKECSEHWRREIKQAFETGKTVVVYLPALQEVFVDSGKREYSGTGRNQRATRLVEPYSNYRSIPSNLSPVQASGSSMKLVDRGAEVLAPYWKEFEAISKYQVILTSEKITPCITTRAGNKAVGTLFRNMASSGTLLLLPDIDFDADEFSEIKNGNVVWTKAAQQFAGRFVSSIVSLDKALRSALEVTPEPAWASDNRFVLASEQKLRVNLLEAEKRVEEAQHHKESISDALREAGALRALLYEKGKPLEAAIISALRALGFKAEPFKESDSEFDVVFECDEGRLIGEAEGKDSKAVNIDKLRQLAMNIHEDLQREEVTVPAKPVLFGNGYRLQALQERADPFTEKCHSAASTSSTALVFTPDLFPPVQYLASTADDSYARACRQAILSSTGRVIFPPAPTPEEASVTAAVEIERDA